jgi:hypothetical protein
MACWKGYSAKGMKLKGGKLVPNCTPVKKNKKTKSAKK